MRLEVLKGWITCAAIIYSIGSVGTVYAQTSLGDLLEIGRRVLESQPQREPEPQVPIQPTAPQRQTTTLPSTQPLQTQPVRASRETVRTLQSRLAELGYDPGPADGLMGRRTRTAILAFQRDNNLRQTGEPNVEVESAVASAWAARVGTHRRLTGETLTEEPVQSTNPSFDCQRASTPTEFAICGSGALSMMDSKIRDVYVTTRERLGPADKARLVEDQRGFLQQRDRCSADHACLDRVMRQRLTELDEISRRDVVFSQTTRTAERPNFPVAAGQQPTAAQQLSAINALQDLQVIDGRPLIFSAGQRVPTDLNRKEMETNIARLLLIAGFRDPEPRLQEPTFLVEMVSLLGVGELRNILRGVFGTIPPDLENRLKQVARNNNADTIQSIYQFELKDEFDRRAFQKIARESVTEFMSGARLPTPLPVRIYCLVRLGDYDFAAQKFPIGVGRRRSCENSRLRVMRGHYQILTTRFSSFPNSINLEAGKAKMLLSSIGGSKVAFLSYDAVFSITFPADQNGGKSPTYEAVSVGNFALNSGTQHDAILYSFGENDLDHFAPPQTAAADASTASSPSGSFGKGWERVPETALALKFAFDLISDETWLKLTERQIIYEQQAAYSELRVFSASELTGRVANFAAPELLETYKTRVKGFLNAVPERFFVTDEIMPSWVAYQNGALRAKRSPTRFDDYLRELYTFDEKQSAAIPGLGARALIDASGFQAKQPLGALPRSVTQDAQHLINSVMIALDRKPRIKAIEMSPSEAERLFKNGGCGALNEAVLQVAGGVAKGVLTDEDFEKADDEFRRCMRNPPPSRERFASDYEFQITGARRAPLGVLLEAKLVGAELYALNGENFASLGAEDFPLADDPIKLAAERKAAEAAAREAERARMQADKEAKRVAALEVQQQAEEAKRIEREEVADQTAQPFFDILGVKLGDDFETSVGNVMAEIGATESFYARRELRQKLQSPGNGPPIENWAAFHNATLLHVPASKDMVSLYHEPPTSPDVVTGISRTRVFEPGKGPGVEAIVALLEQKYGPLEDRAKRNLKLLIWTSAPKREKRADGRLPPAETVNAAASACARSTVAAASTNAIFFALERQGRDEGNIPRNKLPWTDENDEIWIAPDAHPIEMAPLMGERGDCPPYEFLLVWINDGSDGRVIELRLALARPSAVARISEELRKQLMSAPADTSEDAAPIKL
jgi:uncharacterized protein